MCTQIYYLKYFICRANRIVITLFRVTNTESLMGHNRQEMCESLRVAYLLQRWQLCSKINRLAREYVCSVSQCPLKPVVRPCEKSPVFTMSLHLIPTETGLFSKDSNSLQPQQCCCFVLSFLLLLFLEWSPELGVGVFTTIRHFQTCVVQNSSHWPPEPLKCSYPKLRCAITVKYIEDFEDQVGKISQYFFQL